MQLSTPSSPLSALRSKLLARQGQALVEVLVAVSVLTIGFLGIVTLLSRALALNRVVADSYTATYLAAEGIEIAKNIIDGNTLQDRGWNEGVNPGEYELDYTSLNFTTRYQSRRLVFDPASGFYSYSGAGGTVTTPFTRKISISLVGASEIQVNSEVAWQSRGGARSQINVEDHFYNWR